MSEFTTASRGRRLALGAAAVIAVGLVSAHASNIGAKSASDPVRLDIVSVDPDGVVQEAPETGSPATSDTGGVVAYEVVEASVGTVAAPAGSVAPAGSAETRRVWIRDRVGSTSRAVFELDSVAPGISGNGCLVAYSVIGVDDVTLTVVDRCAVEPKLSLPIGTIVENVKLGAAELGAAELHTAQVDAAAALDLASSAARRVAAPALSFDGSTIVWSTGRDVRRYSRSTPTGSYVRTHTFDSVAVGAPDVATGPSVDVSADGRTVVLVAGPGDTPFAPTPANVYLWTAPASQLDPPTDPELLSAAPSGEPGTAASGSPTISADGTFVVFESIDSGLVVAGGSPVITPFVVGVDLDDRAGRVLAEDASDPTLSADGFHVVYQRDGALRLLSSSATSTNDVGVAELADARPTGAAAISQFGRWIVFGSAAGLAAGPTDSAPAARAPAIWAADLRSSQTEVVDTTVPPTTTAVPTTPTIPTTPTTPTTQPPPSTPTSTTTTTQPELASQSPRPATPVIFTDDVVRFPSDSTPFAVIPFPPPRQVTPPSSSGSFRPGIGDGATAVASPVSFGRTVVDAGRRTQPVTLTNTTSATLQVSVASIDVPDVFTIVSDGCGGASIAPGSSCAVDVQFAPISIGIVAGNVVFRLSDGAIVSASLDGDGVPGPTLDLVPAVAGAGQTVTVFGVGFPAGSIVEFSQPGVASVVPIVVDPDGTFAHVVVVLPNTPIGPAVLAVSGQPDEFDDVTAELLVSGRGVGSGDTAVRGGLGRLPGR